ncbi:MAG: ABC transporter permease, partial [Demequina sp.]|nr:ABC transporter permease [Demequina sp.]
GRRRQIGIERAIGIRSSAIVTGYVLKSLLTATVGTAGGWALFRFLIMPLVERHPFQFPTGPSVLETSPGSALQTVVILLTVAAVSALIPAVRTAQMRILDAIWGN